MVAGWCGDVLHLRGGMYWVVKLYRSYTSTNKKRIKSTWEVREFTFECLPFESCGRGMLVGFTKSEKDIYRKPIFVVTETGSFFRFLQTTLKILGW